MSLITDAHQPTHLTDVIIPTRHVCRSPYHTPCASKRLISPNSHPRSVPFPSPLPPSRVFRHLLPFLPSSSRSLATLAPHLAVRLLQVGREAGSIAERRREHPLLIATVTHYTMKLRPSYTLHTDVTRLLQNTTWPLLILCGNRRRETGFAGCRGEWIVSGELTRTQRRTPAADTWQTPGRHLAPADITTYTHTVFQIPHCHMHWSLDGAHRHPIADSVIDRISGPILSSTHRADRGSTSSQEQIVALTCRSWPPHARAWPPLNTLGSRYALPGLALCRLFSALHNLAT